MTRHEILTSDELAVSALWCSSGAFGSLKQSVVRSLNSRLLAPRVSFWLGTLQNMLLAVSTWKRMLFGPGSMLPLSSKAKPRSALALKAAGVPPIIVIGSSG